MSIFRPLLTQRSEFVIIRLPKGDGGQGTMSESETPRHRCFVTTCGLDYDHYGGHRTLSGHPIGDVAGLEDFLRVSRDKWKQRAEKAERALMAFLELKCSHCGDELTRR